MNYQQFAPIKLEPLIKGEREERGEKKEGQKTHVF